MKRLIFWMLTLFLLTTALTGGVVAYARTQGGENPLKAMGFDLCDGKPCFLKIAPNASLQDAKNKVAKVGFIETFNGIDVTIQGNIAHFQLLADDHTRIVLLPGMNSPWPSVADLIQQYGNPCKVYGSMDRFVLIYPSMAVAVLLHGNRIEPFSHPLQMILDSTEGCEQIKGIPTIPWFGFASMSNYIGHGMPSEWLQW